MTRAMIEEAIGELGAAIGQSSPSDDQVIMDRVRTAHRLLQSAQPQMSATGDKQIMSLSGDIALVERLREIGTESRITHEEQLALNAAADALLLASVKFEYQDKDDTDGPSFWWDNPWTGQREKIANLWWPGHPSDFTDLIERLFAGLTLQFNPNR